MKKSYETNADILALICPGLPSLAMFLFNRPSRGILSRLRPPVG